MAKKAKKSTRGRKPDRARVAGGQDYEVRYTAKRAGKSASTVKKAVKKVGSSRKKVTKALKGGSGDFLSQGLEHLLNHPHPLKAK